MSSYHLAALPMRSKKYPEISIHMFWEKDTGYIVEIRVPDSKENFSRNLDRFVYPSNADALRGCADIIEKWEY